MVESQQALARLLVSCPRAGTPGQGLPSRRTGQASCSAFFGYQPKTARANSQLAKIRLHAVRVASRAGPLPCSGRTTRYTGCLATDWQESQWILETAADRLGIHGLSLQP